MKSVALSTSGIVKHVKKSLYTGKHKRELVVADETGSTTSALCEDDTDKLEEHALYRLNCFQVTKDQVKSNLAYPRYEASIMLFQT